MPHIIEFTYERSYGRGRYYPKNRLARALVAVAERVCFEREALAELNTAGFAVYVDNRYWAFHARQLAREKRRNERLK